MLLRRQSLTQHRVVGQCFQDGLDNAEGLLGPLPDEFVMQMHRPNGVYQPSFLNTKEEKVCEEDPRLGEMPRSWEKIDFTPSQDDPIYAVKYRNKDTDEVLNSDPRLLPDMLRARGVNLQTFRLV